MNAAGSDPDGTAVTFAWDLNNDNAFETAGQSANFTAVDGPGSYTVQVQVTDETGAKSTAQAVVNVANVNPTAGTVSGPVAPLAVNTLASFSVTFTVPGVLDTHTAVWDWDDGTTSTATVSEANGSGTASGSHSYAAPGVYTVVVTVKDKDNGTAQATFQYVVVFDPNGGFVTVGGWINSPAGAYSPDPTLTGKANFGFVSKYQKGTTVPAGNTQFQFQAGGSTSRAQAMNGS